MEKAATRMLEVVAEIDGRPLSRWGCDGVICATPTGSTAYAFSAGRAGGLAGGGGACSWCRSARTRCSPGRWSSRRAPRSPSRSCPTRPAAVLWCDGRRALRPAVRRAGGGPARRRAGTAGPAARRGEHRRAVHRPAGRQVRTTRSRAGAEGCVPEPNRWHRARRITRTALRRAGADSQVTGVGSATKGRGGPHPGLGVIDEAVLELSPGFNVVTGETGAGKTMVVTGLGLLFGGRADPSRVRPGADKATVEGTLVIEPGGRVAQQVEDIGGELDDGELIISRTVSAEGRSRAWLGGRTVPVGTSTYLADDLVAVHGQMDQQRLLQPARQRAALDRYAGDDLVKPLRAYTQALQAAQAGRRAARRADHQGQGAGAGGRPAPVRPGGDREGRPQGRARTPTLRGEEERLSHADALRGAATDRPHGAARRPDGGRERRRRRDLAAGRGPLRRRGGARLRHRSSPSMADRLAEAGYLISDVGHRPGRLRRVDRGRPRPAGRRPGAAGRADRAHPQVRRGHAPSVLAWAQRGRGPAGRARGRRRAHRRADAASTRS